MARAVELFEERRDVETEGTGSDARYTIYTCYEVNFRLGKQRVALKASINQLLLWFGRDQSCAILKTDKFNIV